MDVKLLMRKGNRLFTNVCLEVAWLGLIEIKKLENKDLNQTLSDSFCLFFFVI